MQAASSLAACGEWIGPNRARSSVAPFGYIVDQNRLDASRRPRAEMASRRALARRFLPRHLPWPLRALPWPGLRGTHALRDKSAGAIRRPRPGAADCCSSHRTAPGPSRSTRCDRSSRSWQVPFSSLQLMVRSGPDSVQWRSAMSLKRQPTEVKQGTCHVAQPPSAVWIALHSRHRLYELLCTAGGGCATFGIRIERLNRPISERCRSAAAGRRRGRDFAGKPELAADDVGALRDGAGLVERDLAVAALAAEAAVARHDQLLRRDVLAAPCGFRRPRPRAGPPAACGG